jgi:long-chain acyl-CoA synthetase
MLVDSLLEAARRHPKRLAVADERFSLSYRNLLRLAVAFRGVINSETKAERIGVLLPAGSLFPAAFFGALWAGRIVVPLNLLLKPEELAPIVKHAGLDLVITVKPLRRLLSESPVRAVMIEDLPLKRRAFMAAILPKPPLPVVAPDDTAVLLYTSGTSGNPKGVELTYQNLRSNCDRTIEAARMNPSQVFLNVLPPFHVFGLTCNVIIPVVLGASVWAIMRFHPRRTLETIVEKKVSVFLAIPSMYAAMLKVKDAPPIAMKDMEIVISGGEPLPPSVSEEVRARFGAEIREGYGLSETSPVVSLCTQHDYKPGSVGRVIPGTEVRIADNGEILVRGPGVMKRYYLDSEATEAAIDSDGWFHTGDMGRFDDDGFLYITGRIKDMIIVGGENVFPVEIERVLLEFDGVGEAAVIGVPDGLRGEVPLAFVVPSDESELDGTRIRQFARDRLAGHKVPREVRIVDELPHGPTGKVLKRVLKESMAE